MSFELVAATEAHHPKALMCRALGLSRSGHHSFCTRGPSRRALGQQQLDLLVASTFTELKGRYGAPRIEKESAGFWESGSTPSCRERHCTARWRDAARRQG